LPSILPCEIRAFAGELFKTLAGRRHGSRAYRGGALALIDLLARQVQVYFATTPPSIEFIKAGKLRASPSEDTSSASIIWHRT
jgi:tripartite-type tricarboxylate transporter receptor subunit TctC